MNSAACDAVNLDMQRGNLSDSVVSENHSDSSFSLKWGNTNKYCFNSDTSSQIDQDCRLTQKTVTADRELVDVHNSDLLSEVDNVSHLSGSTLQRGNVTTHVCVGKDKAVLMDSIPIIPTVYLSPNQSGISVVNNPNLGLRTNECRAADKRVSDVSSLRHLDSDIRLVQSNNLQSANIEEHSDDARSANVWAELSVVAIHVTAYWSSEIQRMVFHRCWKLNCRELSAIW